MKSLNHDTCHLSRHDSDDKKMLDDKDANTFMLLFWLQNNIKSVSAVGYSTVK